MCKRWLSVLLIILDGKYWGFYAACKIFLLTLSSGVEVVGLTLLLRLEVVSGIASVHSCRP
jgi:hypothetical protein